MRLRGFPMFSCNAIMRHNDAVYDRECTKFVEAGRPADAPVPAVCPPAAAPPSAPRVVRVLGNAALGSCIAAHAVDVSVAAGEHGHVAKQCRSRAVAAAAAGSRQWLPSPPQAPPRERRPPALPSHWAPAGRLSRPPRRRRPPRRGPSQLRPRQRRLRWSKAPRPANLRGREGKKVGIAVGVVDGRGRLEEHTTRCRGERGGGAGLHGQRARGRRRRKRSAQGALTPRHSAEAATPDVVPSALPRSA